MDIKKLVNEKNKFDEYTKSILIEYISVASECLSDYISSDEIVRRLILSDTIKNGIKIVNKSSIKTLYESDASYSISDKCIYVDKQIQDKMYLKYIIFHELTHVLSIQIISKDKKIIGLQDMSNNIYIHLGINEAITEYLTLKMCEKKYNYDCKSGYEVAVEQFINMLSVIDLKDIMHCYFYESDKYDELIRNNYYGNINYFDYMFNKLANAQKSIYQMRMKMMPEDERNLTLFYIKKDLYYWYTNKFLPVNSIEKFDAKLKFVKQYIEQHYSLNYVDEFDTYTDILCDMEDLEELGADTNEIYKLIDKYEFDKDKMEYIKDFNFITTIGYEDAERTEKAIELYNKYQELGRNKFCEICDTFFMYLYYVFFIGDPDNNIDLYNYIKIPFLGKFLKENTIYDFDELEIVKVYYSEFINNVNIGHDWFYIIKTYDGKNHIIFEEYDDGTSFKVNESGDNKFILSYEHELISLEIDGNNIKMKNLNNKELEYDIEIIYERQSNYMQLEHIIENIESKETRDSYIDILEKMRIRIEGKTNEV